MADQNEPKARYPRQEVSPGQKHGYIGEVETYERPESGAGYSNAETTKPGKTTTTKATAASTTPAEKPIVGAAGLIGGTVDNVEPPES